MMETATVAPVRKSVTVQTSAQHAFKVYTEAFDSWWPRSHHIGKAPLEKAVMELREGGRCYGHSTDGVDYPWGTVLVWDPPHRFVMSWQITPDWQYEPDLKKSSEVEVRFTAEGPNTTRVDLEHRHFERHGAGGDGMRKAVDSGWTGLLELFAQAAAK